MVRLYRTSVSSAIVESDFFKLWLGYKGKNWAAMHAQCVVVNGGRRDAEMKRKMMRTN